MKNKVSFILASLLIAAPLQAKEISSATLTAIAYDLALCFVSESRNDRHFKRTKMGKATVSNDEAIKSMAAHCDGAEHQTSGLLKTLSNKQNKYLDSEKARHMNNINKYRKILWDKSANSKI